MLTYYVVVVLVAVLSVVHYIKRCNRTCSSKKRLDGRTVLVTGGTSGMGLELAADLAERGARVIVACPFEEEGEAGAKAIIQQSGSENIVFKLLDLSSIASIRKFAEDILANEDRLDILVNNAGTCVRRQFLTADGLNYIMAVNYYGAFLLTLLLMPLLRRSGVQEPARIIKVSSVLHYLGVLDFDGLNVVDKWSAVRVYANSKLCLTVWTRELSRRLTSNVVVHAVDPGAVGTPIFLTYCGKIGILVTFLFKWTQKTAWEGMQTALYVALETHAGKFSGGFFRNCSAGRAKAVVYNEIIAARLWNESAKLVQISDADVERLLHAE